MLVLDEGDDSLAAPLLQCAGEWDIGAEASGCLQPAEVDQASHDGDVVQFASAVFAGQNMGNDGAFGKGYCQPRAAWIAGLFGWLYLDVHSRHAPAVPEHRGNPDLEFARSDGLADGVLNFLSVVADGF